MTDVESWERAHLSHDAEGKTQSQSFLQFIKRKSENLNKFTKIKEIQGEEKYIISPDSTHIFLAIASIQSNFQIEELRKGNQHERMVVYLVWEYIQDVWSHWLALVDQEDHK